MYFSKLVQFQRCRKSLQDEWDICQSGIVETIPGFDHVSVESSGEFRSEMRQQNVSGSVVQSLEELYEAALVAHSVFKQMFVQIALESGVEIGDVRIAPLKAKARALEKSTDDYADRVPGPAIAWLFDIVRGMILCDTEQAVRALIDALTSKKILDDGLEVVRFKNRFMNPTPGGYRDCNMNIRIKVNEMYHICEVQIHHKRILELSKSIHSHSTYEFFRTYFRGNAAAVDARLQIISSVVGEDVIRSIAATTSCGDDHTSSTELTSTSMIDEVVLMLIDEGDGEKLKRLIDLLDLMCDYSNALKVMRKVVSMVEQHHGVLSKDAISAKSQVVNLLVSSGKLSDAQVLIESILSQSEAVYGNNHTDVAVLLQALAFIKQTNRDHLAAKEIYEQALAMMEPILGENDANVLSCWNNIASITCEYLHDLEKGKEIFEKVYLRRQQVLGPDHPHVITSLSNLGAVTSFMRRDEESRRYKLQALERSERFYGPDHLSTLLLKSNLGNELDPMGDSVGAEKMLLEALEGRTRILGPDNFDTIVTTGNVGEHYLFVNDATKAEQYLTSAMDRCCAISVSPEDGFYQHLSRLIREELPVIQRSTQCARMVETLPIDVLCCELHAHILVRVPCVPYPKGAFSCDICKKNGLGIAYRCAECGFDVHPQCLPPVKQVISSQSTTEAYSVSE